jgi:hypothetical protein
VKSPYYEQSVYDTTPHESKRDSVWHEAEAPKLNEVLVRMAYIMLACAPIRDPARVNVAADEE